MYKVLNHLQTLWKKLHSHLRFVKIASALFIHEKIGCVSHMKIEKPIVTITIEVQAQTESAYSLKVVASCKRCTQFKKDPMPNIESMVIFFLLNGHLLYGIMPRNEKLTRTSSINFILFSQKYDLFSISKEILMFRSSFHKFVRWTE